MLMIDVILVMPTGSFLIPLFVDLRADRLDDLHPVRDPRDLPALPLRRRRPGGGHRAGGLKVFSGVEVSARDPHARDLSEVDEPTRHPFGSETATR